MFVCSYNTGSAVVILDAVQSAKCTCWEVLVITAAVVKYWFGVALLSVCLCLCHCVTVCMSVCSGSAVIMSDAEQSETSAWWHS